MGPFGSKHTKCERHSNATSERQKKLFLPRLRKRLFQRSVSSWKRNRKRSSDKHRNEKSHGSHLRRKRDEYSIDHRKENSKETRIGRERSEKEQKEAKTSIKREGTERQSSKIPSKISKSAQRPRKTELRRSLKNTESHESTRAPSEAHSTTSDSTIHRMPDIAVQECQRKHKRKVAVKNSCETLQSWHRIPGWSPSLSSRQSIRNVRKRIKAFFSRPMQDASVQKFVEKIKKRNELRKGSIFKEEVPEIPLRSADEKFPFRRRVERYEPGMREEDIKIILLKKPIPKVINNDNEGKLFDEDGLPFWSKFSKLQKNSEKSIEETTDDDLPMDSEILLDVQAGLRKLVKMPKVR
ncbi:hypothetical protein LOAG_16574 [Loa loa]|uniref:Uncharacterized protein n=1 Tax=Loa loa TaxID=7209 RepID=A0A1S0ULR5_LOALO|nr:hypothetical protein LOAG_16574 [Loa loa]EJD76503.1 hypothetical protein LOAG_16574 [Loa loa]